MIGKGWYIIGALLLGLVLYLFLSISGLKGDVNDLRADVAELQQDAATVTTPTPEASAVPGTASSTDLATAEGRDTQRKQDLARIAEAVVAYRKDKGTYPAGLNELTPDFLEVLPADPSAPEFNYRYKRTSLGFQVTSILEKAGDPDDAKGDGEADKVFTITESFRR